MARKKPGEPIEVEAPSAESELEPELEAESEEDLAAARGTNPTDALAEDSMEIDPHLDIAAEIAEEELDVEEIAASTEMADDPVRLYLKEIGRVELLGSDQEF